MLELCLEKGNEGLEKRFVEEQLRDPDFFGVEEMMLMEDLFALYNSLNRDLGCWPLLLAR